MQSYGKNSFKAGISDITKRGSSVDLDLYFAGLLRATVNIKSINMLDCSFFPVANSMRDRAA